MIELWHVKSVAEKENLTLPRAFRLIAIDRKIQILEARKQKILSKRGLKK